MPTDFTKAIIFSSHDEGRRLVDFVHINQRGGAGLWKTASLQEYSPEVRGMIQDLKPEPGHVYPLINALGAGEYWSSNSNADYFEEDQLNPADGSDKYGFATFKKFARPYKHHINKPDSPAYGEVLGNCYNPRMHRVELLVKISNEKAPDIAERIEAGDDVPVSMGCKVPYDVCSICANEAKSTDKYCDHMKYSPNKIMDDGRKVFVFNVRPRFFDISFVFVGADPTARVLSKVASLDRNMVRFPSGLWAYKMGYHTKGADIDKGADIIKEIPGESTDALKLKQEITDGAQALSTSEEVVSPRTLGKLSAHPLNEVLATATQAGIVFSPREFQYMSLRRMGKTAEAKHFWNHNVTFDETKAHRYSDVYSDALEDFDFSLGRTSTKVAEALAPYIETRSARAPFLAYRAEKVAAERMIPHATAPIDNTPAGRIAPDSGASIIPLLGGLTALYAAYRNKLPVTNFAPAEKVVAQNPAMLALLSALTAGGVMGTNHYLAAKQQEQMARQSIAQQINAEQMQQALSEQLLNDYIKRGSDRTKEAVFGNPLFQMLGLPAMAYLYSGHQQRKRWAGEELGPIDSVMADYPLAGAVGGILGSRSIARNFPKFASVVSKSSVDAIVSCGDRVLTDQKAILDLLKLARRPGGSIASQQLDRKGMS